MDFLSWFPTAAVSALAYVVWSIGSRAIKKLDALEDLMRTELRAMDVRLTRIEAHLWPDRRP